MHRLLTFLALLIASQVARAADNEVVLEAELGYRKKYRVDSFAPLRIRISNSGDGRSLAIIASAKNSTGGRDTFTEFVDLAKGAIKHMSFPILVGGGQETAEDSPGTVLISVTAVDEKGNIVALTCAEASPLTDEFLALYVGPPSRSLSNLGVDPRHGTVIKIPVTELPDDETSLEGVDAVVIAEPGEALVSFPDKAAALRKWVRSGGLVIAWDRPQNFVRPLSQWEGFVPGLAMESAPVDSGADRADSAFRAGATAPRLDDSRGARELWDATGTLAAAVYEGTGCAVFLAYDPDDTNIIAPDEQAKMFAAVVRRHSRNLSDESKHDGDWITAASQSVCDTFGVRPVSYSFFVVLFSAFALAAGPGIALAVGKRRRPLVWVLVPVLSAGVAVSAYLYANAGRPGRTQIHQVTFADVTADGKAGSYDAVAGLFAPSRGGYGMEFAGPSGAAGSLPHFRQSDWRYRRMSLSAVDTELARAPVFTGHMNPFSARAFRVSGELPPVFLDRLFGGFRLIDGGSRGLMLENRSSITLAGGYLVSETKAAWFGPVGPGGRSVESGAFLTDDKRNLLDWRKLREGPGNDDSRVGLPGLVTFSRQLTGWCPFERRPPCGPFHRLMVAFVADPSAGLRVSGGGPVATETTVLMTILRIEKQ